MVTSARPEALNKDQEALEQRLARLSLTIEKAPVGIAHVSPGGQWLMVNQQLCKFLGYSPAELMKKTFQDLTYPPDLAEDLAQVDRLLRNEISGYSMEKRYVRKDGKLVWALLTVSLIRNSEGSPEYFISVVQDINLRKRMEADLERSQMRLQLLRVLPGVGFWELNLDSGKCNWSSETYDLMEQDPGMEPSLNSFIAMVHPGDRKRVEKALATAVKGQRQYDVTFRIVTPQKKTKQIISRGYVFYNLGNPVLTGVAWEKK